MIINKTKEELSSSEIKKNQNPWNIPVNQQDSGINHELQSCKGTPARPGGWSLNHNSPRIPKLTIIDFIELLWPHLKGKVTEGKSFPCPLPTHKENDDRPIIWEVGEGSIGQFQGWRCSAGCEGEHVKDTIDFIQIALSLEDQDQGYAVYHALNDLKNLGASYEELVDLIRTLFPDWY
jgi:hypothetical protein